MLRAILTGSVAVIAALVCLGLGNAPSASANGVPQLVKLEYVPGTSNWGPEDAAGLLEFSFAEGYAIVDVKNLPATDGTTFEGWMRNAEGDMVDIGEIPTDAAGIGHLEAKLTGLTRYDYNEFLVGARTASDTAGEFPAQISVVGNFSVIGDDPADSSGEQRPQVLPNTGEATTSGPPVSRAFMAMMAMAATGLTIVIVAQFRKRRRA